MNNPVAKNMHKFHRPKVIEQDKYEELEKELEKEIEEWYREHKEKDE